MSITIRILAISFRLISTKSKWASHSNFLYLKKLNYPQHLLHITQTPFSKLNFLIGFSIAFFTNVTDRNFYISFKIVIAWFSKVLTLCRTIHLKPNFSWFQVRLWVFALLKNQAPGSQNCQLVCLWLCNSDNGVWQFWGCLTSASIPIFLSHHFRSLLLTQRFIWLLLSIHSFNSSFAIASSPLLHLTPTTSLAHCSRLGEVDSHCQMRYKFLAHYSKAWLSLDRIAAPAFTGSIQLHPVCSWLEGRGQTCRHQSSSTQINGTDSPRFYLPKSHLYPVFLCR